MASGHCMPFFCFFSIILRSMIPFVSLTNSFFLVFGVLWASSWLFDVPVIFFIPTLPQEDASARKHLLQQMAKRVASRCETYAGTPEHPHTHCPHTVTRTYPETRTPLPTPNCVTNPTRYVHPLRNRPPGEQSCGIRQGEGRQRIAREHPPPVVAPRAPPVAPAPAPATRGAPVEQQRRVRRRRNCRLARSAPSVGSSGSIRTSPVCLRSREREGPGRLRRPRQRQRWCRRRRLAGPAPRGEAMRVVRPPRMESPVRRRWA